MKIIEILIHLLKGLFRYFKFLIVTTSSLGLAMLVIISFKLDGILALIIGFIVALISLNLLSRLANYIQPPK